MIEIAWDNFTPWSALAGGVIIGLSAAAFILLNGRIAGISGILGGLLVPQKRDVLWRVAFLAGMLAAPVIWMMTADLPAIEINASYPVIVVAGLLVGIGTRYGSGCTSGHGVCGLSRLSVRSLLATLTFMVAGFATVYIVRHLLTGA
ncbi:YeeE/YedE [Marinobacter vulgaris]|uniref:YeeE/YedE n=1 Tax=Marinobacter vulgaris TaxID=1928331 RepID=A0A2V3ZM78_9GAMM|nr:YeeE/YedE family protein [Marinobacter vulgaris]PXX91912.1 YeeE/YedE [Marinobacter vulgaris]TSJ70576.1 YeeE/YedE family protein [Marinobacter vulgaris]